MKSIALPRFPNSKSMLRKTFINRVPRFDSHGKRCRQCTHGNSTIVMPWSMSLVSFKAWLNHIPSYSTSAMRRMTKCLPCFLTGWIFPTDTSINISLYQNPSLSPIFPYLQVLNSQGDWQTVIDVIGIPAGKNKTIVVDLTGKFLSADRRVKIATDMQIYWDSAFFHNRRT